MGIFDRMDALKTAHLELEEYYKSHHNHLLQKADEILVIKARIHEKERLLLMDLLPSHLGIKENEFFRGLGSLMNSVAWGMDRQEAPRSVPQRT